MLNKTNIFILILFSFLFHRCSTINQRGLHRDLTRLLAKHHITEVNLKCDMSNLIRSGKCVFKQPKESLDRIIYELQLKDMKLIAEQVEAKGGILEIESDYDSEFLQYVWQWDRYISDRKISLEQSHTCDSVEEFRNLDSIEIYGSWHFNPKIRLGDGGAFSEFLLYHRPDTNDVCIAVTYAYG